VSSSSPTNGGGGGVATTSAPQSSSASVSPTTTPSRDDPRVLDSGDGEIFPFQVSGHDLMLRTRRGNVRLLSFFCLSCVSLVFGLNSFCSIAQIVKVATEREVRFYERAASVTPQLLDFVPKYYGILSFRDVNLLRSQNAPSEN
jgi:hypothetical protein